MQSTHIGTTVIFSCPSCCKFVHIRKTETGTREEGHDPECSLDKSQDSSA